ncbi:MAG: hypothetical protein E7103_10090 [Prevotella sp.]|nr:hypothetical protein [Prevotella sp.]
MKRIISAKYHMMAMIVAVCVTFAACGGDDKDDDPGNVVKTTTGVHRIDVEFSGATDSWNLQVMFIGTHGNTTSVDLYENGKKLGTEVPGTFIGDTFRNYSVETDASCDLFEVTLSAIPKTNPGSFTVTLKGYVNGKQTNMKVFEFKPDAQVKGCIFYSEDFGADIIQ